MLVPTTVNNLRIIQSRIDTLKQVSRTDILQGIVNNLSTISIDAEESDSERSSLNIFGVAGVGKTFLNSHIFAYCLEEQYPCIWIDFDTIRSSAFDIPKGNLKDAIESLRQIPALKFLPRTVVPAKGDPESAEAISIRWIGYNPQVEPLKPLVVLLDHLDDVSFWRWIQEEIIKPLIGQHPSLVICVSRSPLYWHFWELRARCSTISLERFSYAQTLEFLRLFQRELLGPSVYALTQGYPLKLAELKQRLGFDDRANTTDILTDDVESMLSALTPITRSALEYTGLLRRLEVDVMQAILDEVTPGWNGHQTPHKTLLSDVIPELTSHQYFEPYRRGQPYRLDSTLRYTLTERLRSTHPQQFNQVCKLLERIYRERYLAKPIEDTLALNEWLYISAICGVSAIDITDWKEHLTTLLTRGKLAGRRTIVQIYKDVDVISRLEAFGLFIILQELMRKYFSIDESAPPIFNTTELEQYKLSLINQLSDQPPLTEIPKYIPGGLLFLLRSIKIQGPQFDLPTLQAFLNERSSVEIKRGTINQAVAILQSSGLAEYSRYDRTYQLTPLALSLVGDVHLSVISAKPN
jgi:hypothetical protein